jgi:predicted DNA-binding transcriptional regulator AlpA
VFDSARGTPSGNRYVREKEAATFLGVSVSTLQDWRSRMTGGGPPVTKVGGMVMYSMKGLEEYMEQRTSEGR